MRYRFEIDVVSHAHSHMYTKSNIQNNVYYIHTEIYSPKSYVVNFHTQMSSSQSEARTMFCTHEKMIRPTRIVSAVFHV